MNELRWILLAAGLLLIAGIYLWGRRSRRRSIAPEHERMVRVEPARVVSVAAEPPRVEPGVGFEEPDDGGPGAAEFGDSGAADQIDEEPVPRRPAAGLVRREPRFEARLEPRFDARDATRDPHARVEPPLEPAIAEPEETPAEAPRASAHQEPRKPPQKIMAIRVVAPAGRQFEGGQLLDAVVAEGFTFGRYEIFHRLDAAGKPVVSLASLKEPGTFDPDAMAGGEFRGVALFTVMPGPLPPLRAFEELLAAARSLSARLNGQLQDERGVPLSLQRASHLREEVADFERARAAAPGA